jgi:hypothetical protein
MDVLVEGILSKSKIENVYVVFKDRNMEEVFTTEDAAETYCTEMKFMIICAKYTYLPINKKREFSDFCMNHGTSVDELDWSKRLSLKLLEHDKNAIVNRFYDELSRFVYTQPCYYVNEMPLHSTYKTSFNLK